MCYIWNVTVFIRVNVCGPYWYTYGFRRLNFENFWKWLMFFEIFLKIVGGHDNQLLGWAIRPDQNCRFFYYKTDFFPLISDKSGEFCQITCRKGASLLKWFYLVRIRNWWCSSGLMLQTGIASYMSKILKKMVRA